MNILFFGPFNYRARDNESLMIKFREMGHRVYFLTMSEGNFIIPFLEANGIECFKMDITVGGKMDILKQLFFLRRLIRQKKIARVFSHLEPANLLSVFAQHLTSAQFYIVRHHSDDMLLLNEHKKLSYRLTYLLAKKIIVVSNYAKKVMTLQEGIDPRKIEVVPLSYDFSLFNIPDVDRVTKIRTEFETSLLILCAGRLVENKKFDEAIDIAALLKLKGIEFKMIILGEGPLAALLKQMIVDKNLDNCCYLEGYKENIIDYIEASNLVLHPSISESSSVIVKEAGLRRKMVIAREGVGDFDEIITDDNGVLFPRSIFSTAVVDYISQHRNDPEIFNRMGNKLYSTIREKFDIDRNIHLYQKYLS